MMHARALEKLQFMQNEIKPKCSRFSTKHTRYAESIPSAMVMYHAIQKRF